MVPVDDERLDELLGLWEQAYATGGDPAPAELCPDGSPEFLAALAEGIECLKGFAGGGFGPVKPSAGDGAASFRADAYEGIEKIEEGGQGQVIRARDRRLGREVAVKVPKAQWAGVAAVTRRFEQEARICGGLEHPGVVPVYGFGHDAAGRPYYAMRYVRKERTLEHAVGTVHGMPAGPARTLAYQSLLRQFLTVCRTVAYAHDRDVIHRDLKPANVLVGEYGEVFVVDWGIAKELRREEGSAGPPDADRDPAQTASSSRTAGPLGTPVFMSPEQAEDAGRVGPASDVYSLGATLYHILTGRPPFVSEGGDVPAILNRVKAGTFVPPDRVAPRVPRALAAVCLKAMSRDPANRYAGAGDLASEVERWLADEPVAAWRDPVSVRLRRWAKRHRTLVAAGAALLVMSVATLAVAAGLLAETSRQRLEFIGQLERKNAELADANYLNQFSAAWAAWGQMDIGRAEAILDECDADRRSFEWHYLKELCQGNRKILYSAKSPVRSLIASPNGKWIAVSEESQEIRLLDAKTGEERPLPKNRPYFHHTYQTGSFHPDGSRFSAVVTRIIDAGDRTEFVYTWNTMTGDARDPIPIVLYTNVPTLVGYRDAGRELAGVSSRSDELILKCWDSASGQWLRDIPLGIPTTGAFLSAVLSADGQRLAAWSRQVVRVRHIDAKKDFTLKNRYGSIYAAAFSPDGKTIAFADDSMVRVWDADTDKELLTLNGHNLPVRSVAFSPDGKRIASAGEDRGIKIWDASSGVELMTLRGHTDLIKAVTFLDESRLASGGEAGRVHVWRVAPPESEVIEGVGGVQSLQFSRDGRLYSGHVGEKPFSRGIRVTNFENGTTDELPALAPMFTFSPDGSTLAAAKLGAVEIWDVAAKKLLRTIDNPEGPLAFSPDGGTLAAVSKDLQTTPMVKGPNPTITERKTVLILDVGTGEVRRRLEHDHGVRALAWHPTGGKLFTFAADSTVTVWETRTWTWVQQFNTAQGDHWKGSDHYLAISADGKHLATAGRMTPATVRVWNPETGELRWETNSHLREITALAFTPDSRRLASASEDRTVRVWDAATGREMLSLPGAKDSVFPFTALAFSPDSRRLAGGSQAIWGTSTKGQIRLWGAAGHR